MTEGRTARPRARAVLAACLVLGLGTTVTVTMAAWTNPELGNATFTASQFVTESNVNGAGYADNASSPGPTVTLTGPFVPGTTRYFSILVRAKAGSVAGTVAVPGANVTGDAATLGAALRYRVVRTTGSCAANAFNGSPTYVVGASSTTRPLSNAQETGVTNALAAGGASTPGAATGFCFEVSLPSGAASSLQGKSVVASWALTSTSS